MTVQYLELRSPQDGSVRAEGVVFSNGKVAVSWGGAHESVVVWNSLEDAKAIHVGVGGWTIVILNATGQVIEIVGPDDWELKRDLANE